MTARRFWLRLALCPVLGLTLAVLGMVAIAIWIPIWLYLVIQGRRGR